MSFSYVPNFPKKTEKVDFKTEYSYGGDQRASALLSQVSEARENTLSGLSKLETEFSELENHVKSYLSLVTFFNVGADLANNQSETGKEKEKENENEKEKEKEKEKGKETEKEKDVEKTEGEEKVDVNVPLARGCSFTWTNFSRYGKDTSSGGVDFEIYSIQLSYGLWLMEKAHSLLADSDHTKIDQNQKSANQLYLAAAGVFEFIAKKPYGLKENDLCDLRIGVIKCLYNQSLAEAICIAIERAESAKHTEDIIAGLCRTAYTHFLEAKNELTSPNPNPKPDPNKKWLAYLEYKSLLSQTKSYFYQGLHYSNPELSSIGKSVRIMGEVSTLVDKCRYALRHMMETPPTLNTQFKDANVSFNDFQQKALSACDKIKRENETVYFEKVPDELPEMVDARPTPSHSNYAEVTVDSSKWTEEVGKLIHSKQDKVSLQEKKKEEPRQQSSGCCTLL